MTNNHVSITARDVSMATFRVAELKVAVEVEFDCGAIVCHDKVMPVPSREFSNVKPSFS